jgi:hypothetical protein
MNSVELISSFSDFAREKNIDKPTMNSVPMKTSMSLSTPKVVT